MGLIKNWHFAPKPGRTGPGNPHFLTDFGSLPQTNRRRLSESIPPYFVVRQGEAFLWQGRAQRWSARPTGGRTDDGLLGASGVKWRANSLGAPPANAWRRRCLEALLVAGPGAVPAHQTLQTAQADAMTARLQLVVHGCRC